MHSMKITSALLMSEFFKNFANAIVAENDVFKYRISVCNDCDSFLKTRQCKECLCFMDLKARLGSSSCPKGKW